MKKFASIVLTALTIGAASCSNKTTEQKNLQTAEATIADTIQLALKAKGYDYEFFEYDGYFRAKHGESGANLDVNPDTTISFFLYNRGDAVAESDKQFTDKVVTTLKQLGYKNQGAGPENCDNYFTMDEPKLIAPETIEKALADNGIDVKYCKLIGGGSLTITAKDGKPHSNGKSNIAVSGDSDISFFSDQLDPTLDSDVVAIIESLGYEETGKGEDGSTHFFKKQQ